MTLSNAYFKHNSPQVLNLISAKRLRGDTFRRNTIHGKAYISQARGNSSCWERENPYSDVSCHGWAMLIWTPLTEGNNTPLGCLFREIEHIKLQSISLWFTPSDPFLHENRELCKYHKATVTVANAEQHCSATSRKKTCSSHVHSTLSIRSCHDPDTTQWFPYSSSGYWQRGKINGQGFEPSSRIKA